MLSWLFKKNKTEEVKVDNPDMQEVWLSGFDNGFNRAWETMSSYFSKSIENSNKLVHDQAFDKALDGLSTAIDNKIDLLGRHHLKDIRAIIDKKEELKEKLKNIKNETDRFKVTNYIEALEWMINGDLLQKAEH